MYLSPAQFLIVIVFRNQTKGDALGLALFIDIKTHVLTIFLKTEIHENRAKVSISEPL